MADEARTDRITAGELAEIIGRHPDWHDLPVLLLSMSDDAVWLTEVEQDCFDPADGPVLSLLAHAPAVEEPLANSRPVTADPTAVKQGDASKAAKQIGAFLDLWDARPGGARPDRVAYVMNEQGAAFEPQAWLLASDLRALLADGAALAQAMAEPEQMRDAHPQRIGGCQCDWLEAENLRLWDRAAEADYATTRAGLRAAQLHLVLGSVLATFAKRPHARSDVRRISEVETATLHRWRQVFEANRPSARNTEAGGADQYQNLREQLVAAGTEAADLWLATRANRRMSEVNRRRLAGHVVGTLWEHIERAAIEIAQSIAEDDRAEAVRLRTELTEQRNRRDLCPVTFEGSFKVHYCQRERGHGGRHHAIMGNDWAAMKDHKACGLLWGSHPADTEVVDASQLDQRDTAVRDAHAEAEADRIRRDGDPSAH